jgi:hypothetical protein
MQWLESRKNPKNNDVCEDFRASSSGWKLNYKLFFDRDGCSERENASSPLRGRDASRYFTQNRREIALSSACKTFNKCFAPCWAAGFG